MHEHSVEDSAAAEAPPGAMLALCTLDEAAGNEALAGGKAARLGALAALDLPVPPAFVVTTSATLASLRAAGLEPVFRAAALALASGDGDRARAAARAAAQAILAAPVEAGLGLQIARAYGRLLSRPLSSDGPTSSAPLFAVRSSAVGEDGVARSHAGQFESYLNLRGVEPIQDAVRKVWASWFSERAVRFRLHARDEAAAGTDDAPAPDRALFPPMAVLVQRMVPPRASGMLFTANPVSGSRREMTLEAGPGLGEALAQGRVHPDYFLVQRLGRAGERLRIAERAIARKERQLAALPHGTGELQFQPVPEALRDKPCLDDAEIRALCALGLRIEAELGCPVDVEWTLDPSGHIHLLQARPITALRTPLRERASLEEAAALLQRERERASQHVRGARGDRGAPGPAGTSSDGSGQQTIADLRARPILWTQRFSGERWTEQATPLGWSIVRPLLNHFTHWEDASARWLGGTEPTRLYRGRPYFNVAIFRHLAFRLPGASPPQFLLEMFPPDEQRLLVEGPPYVPNLALVGSILGQVVTEKRWRRYRYNFVTNHAEWEAFKPRFETRIEALPLDFATASEGLDVVEQARQMMTEYLGIHLLSLLFAHLSYEALHRALRTWLGVEGDAIRSALVADPEDNLTLRTNRALWSLAGEARIHPEVTARLCEPEPPSPAELAPLPGGPAFLRSFDAFLDEYGHRSSASWEIFATRWVDNPELVLRMLGTYLRGGMSGDPAEQEERRHRERAQAERLVRSRMTRSLPRRLLPWRQAIFERLLRLTRSYMALRENQRFSFDRLLLRCKRIFERVGALLERDGLVASGEQVVFLEIDELRSLASGSLDPDVAAQRIRRRQTEFDANRELTHPDFLQAGREPGQSRMSTPPAGEGEAGTRSLHGQGISPGRVRGTVKVLRSLKEMAKLEPGDILVARATDPGWTPLFLTAAGLILELGSVLSHGAVVAREYSLPGVVNIEGVTETLRDGMEVTVDGDRGEVVVHRAASGPWSSAQDVKQADDDG